MFKKPSFVVAFVTGVLLLYCILIGFNLLLPIVNVVFAISPFLLLWMCYSIIRYGTYDGKELQQDEEWGYEDKGKEELWVF